MSTLSRVDSVEEVNDREQLILAASHESLPSALPQPPATPRKKQILNSPRTPLSARRSRLALPSTPKAEVDTEKENQTILHGADMFGFQQKRTPSKNPDSPWSAQKKRSVPVAAAKVFLTPGRKTLQEKLVEARKEGSDEESESSEEDDDFAEDGLGTNLNFLESVFNAPHEQFFAANISKTSKTSNNTLSKLPTLSAKDFEKIRPSVTEKHRDQIEMLNSWHAEMFPQWLFELTLGKFSLMFYGYGSKMELINTFVDTHLTDAPSITVNGFFPSLTVREILLQIVEGVLQLADSPANPADLLELIKGYFSNNSRKWDKIYVVIHNIDGVNLRNEKSQSLLSQLASIPNIFLLATMDHIQAPLLWDSATASRFNFLWHDVTTFAPYFNESTFESSLLMGSNLSSNKITLRSVSQVLKSVNENARRLFKILVANQIDGNEGMNYETLYARCAAGFITNNDVTFRALLTEFRDHRMIVERDTDDGELLVIPMEKDELAGVLSWLNEQNS